MGKLRRNVILSLATAAVSCILLAGCVPKIVIPAEEKAARSMIIYYSWSGNTKGLAEQIRQKTGAELVRLELVTPYPEEYADCVAEYKKERSGGTWRELKTRIVNLEDYDVIYIGYPIWAGTIPPPIIRLLGQYDFSGKTIVPFCTHGGGGIGKSLADLAALAPNSTIGEVFFTYLHGGDSLSEDLDVWLDKNGPARGRKP